MLFAFCNFIFPEFHLHSGALFQPDPVSHIPCPISPCLHPKGATDVTTTFARIGSDKCSAKEASTSASALDLDAASCLKLQIRKVFAIYAQVWKCSKQLKSAWLRRCSLKSNIFFSETATFLRLSFPFLRRIVFLLRWTSGFFSSWDFLLLIVHTSYLAKLYLIISLTSTYICRTFLLSLF